MMVSFIKENTYFPSYPYEVFLYLKYQRSTKSCACDKSHWQNILRVCQRVRERSHASPDMACLKVHLQSGKLSTERKMNTYLAGILLMEN